MTLPVLGNRDARRLFLDRHALIEAPTGPAKGDDLLTLIKRLGFVQVDSVNTVERAHHMILWSRRQSYRPENLARLLERDRTLFEHWTHDASVIPTDFFGWWKLRFARDAARIKERWTGWQGAEFHDCITKVLTQIGATGPVGTGDVGEDEARAGGGWWNWHPSKTALEYLWHTGEVCVCHRRNFAKVFDLAHRVHPAECAAPAPTEAETIDWACRSALERLGFATSGELAAFWATVRPDEAKAWCTDALARGEIIEIGVEGADGRVRRSFAPPDTFASAARVAEPSSRVRILSPFDPALRDRNRAERIFGFFYRIEIFVPEPKRQYGYYVFPVMEGDRVIGRIDVKAQRSDSQLAVRAFWPEHGISLGKARKERLEAELQRLASFAGCREVTFQNGWLRETRPM